jgi:hypothetical protein
MGKVLLAEIMDAICIKYFYLHEAIRKFKLSPCIFVLLSVQKIADFIYYYSGILLMLNTF